MITNSSAGEEWPTVTVFLSQLELIILLYAKQRETTSDEIISELRQEILEYLSSS